MFVWHRGDLSLVRGVVQGGEKAEAAKRIVLAATAFWLLGANPHASSRQHHDLDVVPAASLSLRIVSTTNTTLLVNSSCASFASCLLHDCRRRRECAACLSLPEIALAAFGPP